MLSVGFHTAHQWSLHTDRRHTAAPAHRQIGALQLRSFLRSTSGRSGPESAPEATDDYLLKQLNSSHLWLPDESDDFGLDDVAAHVASRNKAQVLDFSATGRKSKRKNNKRRPPASTLSEIEPDHGSLPSWVEDLRAEGFDVLGRNGELFLQRGDVQEQASTDTSRSSIDSRPAAQPLASSATPGTAEAGQGAGRRRQQQQQQNVAAVVKMPVSDKSLAVRPEFDPKIWQQSGATDSQEDASNGSLAAKAWYAQQAAGSNTSSSSTAFNSAATASSPSSGRSRQTEATAKSKRQHVQRRLLSFNHPEKLLGFVEQCFPSWSANGCWLLGQQHNGVVQAPTPAEAAAALKGVALAAKRAAYGAVQTQGLARDRRVLGLVECLRLTAPRTPSHQEPSISKRLWAIAKDYWLQPGAAATAAQQQLLAATKLAAAQAASGDTSAQQQTPGGLLNGAGEAPRLGPLLAQLQSAGLKLSKQQLAAAQSLISSRQEDQLRQQAWVSAVWGMASLGGPLFFEQEMEALCQVASAALGRWQLSPFDLSDATWALANSRHWSPLLPQLEVAVLTAGGVEACSAPELITLLWSFATLSYMPKQLLAQLDRKGWCVKPASELPAAQRSSGSSRQPSQATGKRKQKQQAHSLLQQGAQGGRLAELSSSQLSALVWSLACLQQVNSALFKQVWVEVCRRGMEFAGDTRQLVRVHQAALAVQLEASYKPTELFYDEGTRQLLCTAAKTFKQESSFLQSKTHSTYQSSLATTLTRMRVMHVLEDNTTGYSVDITVPGLRVAIEADGPSHMARTKARQGRVMLGATAMKRRHLQGLGWAVLNVAYTDWDMLQTDEQRMAFLKKQLAAAVAATQKGQ